MFGPAATDEDGDTDQDLVLLARSLCYNLYQAGLKKTFRTIRRLETAEQGLEAAFNGQ